MQQRGSPSRLPGGKNRADDPFRCDRMALAVLEEAQSAGEEPVNDLRRLPLALLTDPAAADRLDGDREARGKGFVAVVGIPGFALGPFEQGGGVQDGGTGRHGAPWISRNASSSASRTFAADRAAKLSPAMPL